MANKNSNFSKLKNLKNDFPWFKNHRDLVFFDSAATTLKPQVVINAISNYYQKYSTNTHSIDFPVALDTNTIYQDTRKIVAQLLNCQADEIVFCPSATFALNQIAYSLGFYLKPGDEVILTACEHSSLLLPFYRLAQEKKIVLKFIEVASDGLITVENLTKVLTNKTRIVAFANVNNSLGTVNDVKQLTKVINHYSLKNLSDAVWPFKKILVLIDAAQSISHIKTNVQDWAVDFLAFSGHKIFGPTGIAVWWGKKQWLRLLKPLILGGGMNGRIYQDGNFTFLNPPDVFEGGSPNIAGVFGLQAAIEYLLKIGVTNIAQHQIQLKQYAVREFKKHFPNQIIIYNENQATGTLLFNVNNVFAEDVANYLGHKNICLRSGNFCAKLLSTVIKCASSLRVSFFVYNNETDIDKLVLALQQGFKDGGDFLNDFFK
ncbi:MAG: aminotransferase class V-fold PLP-dependent enzyme [Spiroplasma sp.]|nr:aminotransferase class V-fold PLP-dependent enzyme [Spiroplasma sp.]